MPLVRRLGTILVVTLAFLLLLAGTAFALAPTDGWEIKLVPGTDKMKRGGEDVLPSGDPRISTPAPISFVPEIALDGDRLLYTAFYDRSPELYLYEISTGTVTQITNDESLSVDQHQPQISGEWASWQTNYRRLHLRNLTSGQEKQFDVEGVLAASLLVSGRLAWSVRSPNDVNSLFLYDPARGSAQRIEAAAGLRGFSMDDDHLVWLGGSEGRKVHLYDLQSGAATVLGEAAEPTEAVTIKGQVVAWAERTGERTTMVSFRLDRRERKVLDTFGPFFPAPQTDGRYVAWNGGESNGGARARGYDTETDRLVDFNGEEFQSGGPSLSEGRVAWERDFSGAGRSVILVQDLASGLTTQLTNGPTIDQPPLLSGGNVAWVRYNPRTDSEVGRGIFVARAPGAPVFPVFADLAPNELYRTAIEWLGEEGYASGYPGTQGPEYRAENVLLRSQFAKLLVQLFDIPVSAADVEGAGQSGDVSASAALAELARLGLAKGQAGGDLEPYAPLSRAQAATLLIRVFDFKRPGLLEPAPVSYPGPSFGPTEQGRSVTRAGLNSLLDGLEGFAIYRAEAWLPWDIWAPMTRGDGAQLLFNAAGEYLQP